VQKSYKNYTYHAFVYTLPMFVQFRHSKFEKLHFLFADISDNLEKNPNDGNDGNNGK